MSQKTRLHAFGIGYALLPVMMLRAERVGSPLGLSIRIPEFVRLDEDGVSFNMHADITVGVGFTKVSRYHVIKRPLTGNERVVHKATTGLKRDSKSSSSPPSRLSLATKFRH